MLTSSRLHTLLLGLLALTLVSEPRLASAATDAYGDLLPSRAKMRIGTSRLRHGDSVTSAAFAPDGRAVATASRDGTLSLWETESGKERVRYRGHAGAVLAAIFSRSGECLISGGADGTVRFWRIPHSGETDELLTGEETRCIRLSREEVQAVALSADGSTAATGTADGIVIVWDLNNNKQRQRLSQEGQVYCLALSSDGKLLASNQAASGAVLRDTIKGEILHRLGYSVVASLAFSPDGRALAAGYQHEHLSLWDTHRGTELRVLTGQKLHLPHQGYGVLSVCYSADGRQVAGGGTDNIVRVWDVQTGRQTSEEKGHNDAITVVAFDSKGKRLISGGADNIVRLWDAVTGRNLHPDREPAMPLTSVSLSPDGQTLAVIQSLNQISVWETTVGRGQPLPAALSSSLATAAAFSPLGKTLAVAGSDGRLRFFDFVARTLVTAERDSPRRLERLVWSRDGKALASCGPDHHIDLWDAGKAELLQHMGLQQESYLALAFDRQSDRLATASETDAIRLWDRISGLEKAPISGRFAGALALSFSADGRSLCAAGREGRIRIWELATNQVRYAFDDKAKEITAAAFTPDGRFLAIGDGEGVVRLWDTIAGKERHAFRGHRGPITMLSFAAQAPSLASSSRDTTAILWDLTDLLRTETPPPLELSQRQIDRLWAQLAGDAAAAYEALQTLRRAQRQAVPYLRGRMQPMKIDFARLIDDLDSDEFPKREKASQQLARYGRAAEDHLRQTLKSKPSPEVRHRIKDLLVQMSDASEVVRAEQRELRCIELLESIGTAEARRVLQTLAGGIAEAELTQEAKASLARLIRR